MDKFRNLSSLPKTLISKSNDPHSEVALNDCADLFGDSLSQIGELVAAMEVGLEKKMWAGCCLLAMEDWVIWVCREMEYYSEKKNQFAQRDRGEGRLVVVVDLDF